MLGSERAKNDESLWGSDEKIMEEILVGVWKLVSLSSIDIYSATQWNKFFVFSLGAATSIYEGNVFSYILYYN